VSCVGREEAGADWGRILFTQMPPTALKPQTRPGGRPRYGKSRPGGGPLLRDALESSFADLCAPALLSASASPSWSSCVSSYGSLLAPLCSAGTGWPRHADARVPLMRASSPRSGGNAGSSASPCTDRDAFPRRRSEMPMRPWCTVEQKDIDGFSLGLLARVPMRTRGLLESGLPARVPVAMLPGRHPLA